MRMPGSRSFAFLSGLFASFVCASGVFFLQAEVWKSVFLILFVGLGTFFFVRVYSRLKIYLPLRRFRDEMFRVRGDGADPGKDALADVEKALADINLRHLKEIEKLREIETFRREFLGNVSHELKTPIFAIQGFIDTLLDGALDDPSVNKEFLEKALKNADRLDNLVKDLLIISQLETGQLQMNMEDFRIYELIHEVFESLEYKLTRKGRSVMLKIISNDNENLYVHADRERIRQVLINLVDNAIKYGDPKGTVRVEIVRLSEKKLQIKVGNEGKGIAPEHLPRLFERFYRVDKSRSREKGGTGLGLAIAKHLIEAHREKISVESEWEKGSIFTFSLTKPD